MEVKEFDLKMKRLDISEAVINSVAFINSAYAGINSVAFINSAYADALTLIETVREAVIIRYIDEALLEKLND